MLYFIIGTAGQIKTRDVGGDNGKGGRSAARRKMTRGRSWPRKIKNEEDDRGRLRYSATGGARALRFFLSCWMCLHIAYFNCYWLYNINVFVRYRLLLLDLWLKGASKNEPSQNCTLYLILCCIGPVGLEGSSLPCYRLNWFAVFLNGGNNFCLHLHLH